MKPVILSFLLLLGALLGVAWMNGKFGGGLTSKKVVGEKSLYFEPETILEVGKEAEINLIGKYSQAPVVGFYIQFTYDPAIIKIKGLEVNKDTFNKLIESSVDANLGSVVLRAKSELMPGTLNSGLQRLATIKIEGLKKGGIVVSGSRRPEVTIWEGEKLLEGDFQMQSFKVSVK